MQELCELCDLEVSFMDRPFSRVAQQMNTSISNTNVADCDVVIKEGLCRAD